MQEAELRLLFESGGLLKAIITRIPLGEGWCIQIERKVGGCVLLDSQRENPRKFKTLDAAFRGVKKIGFKGAMVIEDGNS